MLVIVGFIVVIGSILGGYVLHGGNVAVLNQPTEFLVIGGAGVGALIISSPMPLIKNIIAGVVGSMTKKEATQQDFLSLLLLCFELCKTAKANPLSLEPHVENPDQSDIFKRYPSVLGNHHVTHFICDTLKVQISAAMNPYDLEELMDTDINAAHTEEHKAVSTLNRVADAMPGLGIVAAVLGVVITMGKLSQGKEVIGHSVAAALVGTFLGVCLCYGFIQPLAAKIENNLEEDGKFLYVAKAALLAFAKDCSPKVCVEFARRMVPPSSRPSFEEVDKATSQVGGKAAA